MTPLGISFSERKLPNTKLKTVEMEIKILKFLIDLKFMQCHGNFDSCSNRF